METNWIDLRTKMMAERRETNLATAKEMIRAIRQVRAEEQIAAMRRTQTDKTVESERRERAADEHRQQSGSILNFGGLAAVFAQYEYDHDTPTGK